MAREIKTTLALDGEAAFKRAIREASQSITAMGSALTLASAEFKRDGDAMKLMENRSKTLRSEISQQEQIVKALEGAVQDVTEKYGENSREAEKWQAELNRAQARLVNLQSELDNNDQGLDRNGKAFQQAGQAAGQYAGEVKQAEETANSVQFLALDKAIENTTKGLQGLIGGAIEAGKAVWNFTAEASGWADDLATEALKLGIDTTTLQQWNYAAKFVDTDVSTIVKAMDKLVAPSDTVKKALRDMRIPLKEYWDLVTYDDGAVDWKEGYRPAADVFWDLVDAMGAMTDQQQQEALAQELFGKSFRDIIPLLKAGREGWEEYANAAPTVDEERVESLTDFNDSLEALRSNFETLKNSFAAEIAPAMKVIADTFTELVQKFQAWADSDAGKEALAKLSGAISDVFTAFTENVDFDQIIDAVTGAIEGFSGALGWVQQHAGEVASGIRLIFGALVLLKGIQFSNSIIQLFHAMGGVNWAGLGSALGGAGAAGGSAAGAGAAGAAGAAVASAVNGGISVAGLSGLSSAAAALGTSPKLWAAGGVAALYALIGTYNEMGGREGIESRFKALKDLEEISGGVSGGLAVLADQQKTRQALDLLLSPGSQRQSSVDRDATVKWAEEYKQRQAEEQAAMAERLEAIQDAVGPERKAAGEALWDAYKEAGGDWRSISPDDMRAITDSFKGYSDLFNRLHEAMEMLYTYNPGASSMEDLPTDIWETLSKPAEELTPALEEAGENAAKGLAEGIDANSSAAVDAASRMAAAVREAVRSALRIASPSRAMAELGEYVGAGFALGISDSVGQVRAAAGRMALAVGAGAAAYAPSGAGGSTYSPNYSRTMNIDHFYNYSSTDVQDLMAQMSAEERYDSRGRGA